MTFSSVGVRGLCFSLAFGLLPLAAQPATPPVVLDKEYSADMVISQPSGSVTRQTIHNADGKIRLDPSGGDVAPSLVLRPDLQKIYSIVPATKTVMVLPFDAMKIKDRMELANGLKGTFEDLGADNVNGTVCTKYKYTSEDGKVYTLWADTVRRIPVKLASADNSFTLILKNYQAFPQRPELFEIPPGYQTINMPAMPNMPGAETTSPAAP